MPSPQELKHTLKLEAGYELPGGYEVREAKVTMQEKTPHEVYKFPLVVTVQPPQGHVQHMSRKVVHGAESALEEAVRGCGIMYSAYGSPYEVHLEGVEASEASGAGGGVIEVKGLAVARRRRDIPTLAKQHEKQEKGTSSEGEISEEEEEEALKGYRVVKAHFKSSHCPVCGAEFTPGERIAKPAGEQKRGGWTHVACLTQQHHEQYHHE